MTPAEKPEVEIPSAEQPPPELELEDIIVGDGDEAVPGRRVDVHYVGVAWSTGQQFDASWDRGDTFSFGLGEGRVIKGWDQGVAGMKVGGRRRLTIPPALGSAVTTNGVAWPTGEQFDASWDRGAGGAIGPGETLVFVVDLLGVR